MVVRTTQPKVRACTECNGEGTVETCTFGVGLHDVRCPGEDQSGNCDDGLVYA